MNWLAIFLLLLGAASAQELTEERLWTGTNGKTFRGIFIRSLQDGQKIEIASAEGEIFSIALDNLSGPEPDRSSHPEKGGTKGSDDGGQRPTHG